MASTFQPLLPALDDNVAMQKHLFYSEQANWVVPGAVLAGKSPATAEDVKAFVMDLSVKAKVTTYVCLQAEVGPQSTDTEDLGGIQTGNEVDMYPSYAQAVSQVAERNQSSSKPKFVYYGMKDDEIAPSEESLCDLVENIRKKVEDGEVIYVHCKGGSGRTGIVISCLLASLYPDLGADEVLERTQQSFELRARGAGKWVNPKRQSPATEEQKTQVRKVIADAQANIGSPEATTNTENVNTCILM